jgi:hypothetical protein
MLIIPSSVKIHLALGHTDLRKGFDSLAVLVQEGAQEGFVLGLSLRLAQPRCPSPYRRMSDHVQSPPRRIKIVIDVSPPTISSQTDRDWHFALFWPCSCGIRIKRFLCSSVAVLAATNLLSGLGGVLGTMLLTIRGCSRRIVIPGVPGAEYDLRVGRSDAKSFASKSASFSSSMFGALPRQLSHGQRPQRQCRADPKSHDRRRLRNNSDQASRSSCSAGPAA